MDHWDEPQVICIKVIYEDRGMKNECGCEKCRREREEANE